MRRWLAEKKELEEREQTFDGSSFVTKVFRISKATYEWLEEHGNLSATCLHPPEDFGFYALSVEAMVEDDDRWNGWHWLHDDLLNSGLLPHEFRV